MIVVLNNCYPLSKIIIKVIYMLMVDFHYGDVCRVVDMMLRSKWAESKSLVFGYADKRVKDWVGLKKFMENKQVAVVNVAKFINQGLSFDL